MPWRANSATASRRPSGKGDEADVGEVHKKLQYDFFYIKYFSPWLDLLILFRTVKTMLTGFGSR